MAKFSENVVRKWASEHIKKPWVQTINVSKSEVENQKLSLSERMGEIVMTPLKGDIKIVYHFMSEVLNDVFGRNPNLWTIILNENMDRIIISYLESSRAGAYTLMKELDVNMEWAEKASLLIANQKWEEVDSFLRAIGPKEFGIEPGIIKIASIRFFDEFRKIYLEWEKKGDLLLYFLRCFEVVRKIFANKWIKFLPDVPMFDLLKGLVMELATIDAQETRELLTALLPPIKLAIGIKHYDWLALISIIFAEKDFKVQIFDADRSSKYQDLPLKNLPAAMVRDFDVHIAIAINFADFKNLFMHLLKASIPFKKEEYFDLLLNILNFGLNLGGAYALAPFPSSLIEPIAKFLQIFPLPLKFKSSISSLLPEFKDCPLEKLGDFHLGLFFLDGDKLEGAVKISFDRFILTNISTIPVASVKKFFLNKPLREGLKEAGEKAFIRGKEKRAIIAGFQSEMIREILSSFLTADPSRAFSIIGAQLSEITKQKFAICIL